MVEHNPEQIIEIIGYHLGTQCEAPHLYVNENALTKKLDNQMSTGRHECRLKVEYLFKRFITSSGPFELEKFEIDIESDLSKFSDTEGLLISKPAGLVAYSSPFVKLGYHLFSFCLMLSFLDLFYF